MSADVPPCCARCGGSVGFDLATGRSYRLCGWCVRGARRGHCVDCGINTGRRLRCPPCHEKYKTTRDGSVIRTPLPPSPFVLACVRCGSNMRVNRPSAVTPLCPDCGAKAEDAKVTRAQKKAERAQKVRQRGRGR